MSHPLILASTSEIRQSLLRNANVPFTAQAAAIDEESIKAALVHEGARPLEIADALAEGKARKISARFPEHLVLGCDQVLDFEGTILSKPKTPDEARDQLILLRGKRHKLLSAAVIYHDREPIWRHIGEVRLHMREVSDHYLDGYLHRNWDSIRHSVGGYKLEEEGVRLFDRIEGSYFNVLGLPLLELLSYLALRGDIDG